MPPAPPEDKRIGLCVSCQHMRAVRTDRGSVFIQCQRSMTDARYPKYPGLPVLHCRGYEGNERADEKKP